MKNPSQQIIRFFWGTFLLTMVIGWLTLLPGCGEGKKKNAAANSVPAEPVGPAPDNSAATNPSLADTAFHRDTTR